jgi:hypothetical protein
MLFKNPVRTSKRTPHFTITKINWLMLFKEVIAVCTKNHAKPINTKCITDCQSRWFIQFPLARKGLMQYVHFKTQPKFHFVILLFRSRLCHYSVGVPGCTLVSMNRFSTLCGWLVQRQGWRVKGWMWPSEQARSARANSWLDYQRPLEKYEMGER